MASEETVRRRGPFVRAVLIPVLVNNGLVK